MNAQWSRQARPLADIGEMHVRLTLAPNESNVAYPFGSVKPLDMVKVVIYC